MPIHPRSGNRQVVCQLFGARLLESEDLAALRIDGHHADDGAVHRLKNQQQRIAIAGTEQTLQRDCQFVNSLDIVIGGQLACLFKIARSSGQNCSSQLLFF
jgi:hypothetical protein